MILRGCRKKEILLWYDDALYIVLHPLIYEVFIKQGLIRSRCPSYSMTYSSSFLYMIKGGGILLKKKGRLDQTFPTLRRTIWEKKVLIDSSAADDDDDAGTAAVSAGGRYIPPPPLSAALFHGWLRFICHPSLSLLCIQNDDDIRSLGKENNKRVYDLLMVELGRKTTMMWIWFFFS